MSITYEQLVKTNENMPKVPIKGKDYAQVNERVKAFRQLCPNGTITTEIIEMANGVVTMKATVMDENGKVLGTGLAQEKETSSFINKTSYIENCETSAVGRALGFVGIGVDGSMCSAEELVNAITNQESDNKKANDNIITAKEAASLKALCERKGVPSSGYRGKKIEKLTPTEYAEALKQLGAMKDKE